MIKRIFGLILAMCMILDVMPLSIIEASDKDIVLTLPTRMPEEPLKSDKAGGVFIMGTSNASVEEKGHIEVTIYRTGKSDEKASITLSTVDIGALYGKDYRIDDNRYDTDEHISDKTLYEQSTTPERRQKLEEYRKSIENTMNYLSGNIGNVKDNNTDKEDNENTDKKETEDAKENDNFDKSTSPSALDISESDISEN